MIPVGCSVCVDCLCFNFKFLWFYSFQLAQCNPSQSKSCHIRTYITSDWLCFAGTSEDTTYCSAFRHKSRQHTLSLLVCFGSGCKHVHTYVLTCCGLSVTHPNLLPNTTIHFAQYKVCEYYNKCVIIIHLLRTPEQSPRRSWSWLSCTSLGSPPAGPWLSHLLSWFPGLGAGLQYMSGLHSLRLVSPGSFPDRVNGDPCREGRRE